MTTTTKATPNQMTTKRTLNDGNGNGLLSAPSSEEMEI